MCTRNTYYQWVRNTTTRSGIISNVLTLLTYRVLTLISPTRQINKQVSQVKTCSKIPFITQIKSAKKLTCIFPMNQFDQTGGVLNLIGIQKFHYIWNVKKKKKKITRSLTIGEGTCKRLPANGQTINQSFGRRSVPSVSLTGWRCDTSTGASQLSKGHNQQVGQDEQHTV